MSTNEMVEHDNPFAWAWALGTEETIGEGGETIGRAHALPPMPASDISADDDTCRTEALSPVRDDGAGPSSGSSLGLCGPTGLLDSDFASAEPELVSGCRVIEKKEPRSRRKHDPKELDGQRYVCLWSPCGSSRTFTRPAELQRHYVDKHVRPEVYRCTALIHSKLCGKEYYRLDKSRYHIETEHSEKTEFFCPVNLCEAGPYTADLMRIHVSGHNGAPRTIVRQWYVGHFRIRYYLPVCPVVDCGMKLKSSYSFNGHLSCHDLNTRCNSREAFRGAGYCEVTCHPLCPICRVSIDPELRGRVYIEETGRTEYLSDVQSHMYQSHWHEPEMLHKHRTDILKIKNDFASYDFIMDKVFKDILPTASVKK